MSIWWAVAIVQTPRRTFTTPNSTLTALPVPGAQRPVPYRWLYATYRLLQLTVTYMLSAALQLALIRQRFTTPRLLLPATLPAGPPILPIHCQLLKTPTPP